jgi:hypothetical protein
MTINPERHRDHMTFLEAETARLREENYPLKRTTKSTIGAMEFDIPAEITLEVPDEESESWAEKSQKFAGIRSVAFSVHVLVWLVPVLCLRLADVVQCVLHVSGGWDFRGFSVQRVSSCFVWLGVAVAVCTLGCCVAPLCGSLKGLVS